ncbi:Fur family transcriptional regulator [Candidatus Nanosynbacter lyticus]|jgi:ferric uptake regulation protein|uniref:Fur family transcriptional regulator n=1 Tax=Candidatus Nanosynbacter lyticus TaxID=2093824 RepID=A0A6S4GQM1_9BACT|nr:Fur family transcriptional regulator [Candidatus Nanosynbacter lyticus]AJA06392.1 Fur family transcriptional regulator [Candidatus Nanosynbacter lyticus]QCT41407.1 transcriptional repressor [TM7 phylum sp. oral taxon 952]
MTLSEIFEQHGFRLTKPRQQIFDILKNSEIPLTVGDIAKNYKNINRTSIYRTLIIFDRLKIINTIYIGWKNYYELAEPFIPHHHHLYCINCQNAEPIQPKELEKLVDYIGKKYNFIVTKHHFELEGICEKCRHIIEE